MATSGNQIFTSSSANEIELWGPSSRETIIWRRAKFDCACVGELSEGGSAKLDLDTYISWCSDLARDYAGAIYIVTEAAI